MMFASSCLFSPDEQVNWDRVCSRIFAIKNGSQHPVVDPDENIVARLNKGATPTVTSESEETDTVKLLESDGKKEISTCVLRGEGYMGQSAGFTLTYSLERGKAVLEPAKRRTTGDVRIWGMQKNFFFRQFRTLSPRVEITFMCALSKEPTVNSVTAVMKGNLLLMSEETKRHVLANSVEREMRHLGCENKINGPDLINVEMAPRVAG